MSELLEAALEYASRGWHVFPCDRNKAPLVKHGLKEATTDPDQIRAWWERWPSAQVAIRTGRDSDIFVVDSDVKEDGTDGEENLLALAANHTPLPECPETQTPRGGRHRLFAWPIDGRVIRNDTGTRLAPGVDIRGEGGYIIAPPSPGYIWDCPEAPYEPPPAPDWLLELACTERSRSQPVGNEIPSGQRNNTLASLAGAMRRVGMGEVEIYAALVAANESRCNPPLKEREVKKIAESISRYEPDSVAVAVAENHWEQDNPTSLTPGPADPGPIPEELLHIPGFIDEVMEHTLATAPYPERVLAFCGALILQAVLAARKVRDEGDNRTNIYLLGLANSGAGKDWPRKINQRVLVEVDLAKCLGDTFASGEGIEDRMSLTQSVLFQNDEIDGLMTAIHKGRDVRYEGIMNTLLKFYTSAAGYYPMRVKAGKDSGGVIDQPCLCLFGTAIPKHYYEALSVKMLTNGFFARMLVLEAGSRSGGQEPSVPDLPESIIAKARHWAEFKPGGNGNLAEWHPVPMIVPATSEAKQILAAFRKRADEEYSKAEQAGDAAGMALWARANEKARRLALIYACSENYLDPMISARAAEWASRFVEHQTRRMLFMAYGHVAENPFHAECLKLVEKLRSAPNRELPHSVLLKRMKVDARTFENLIKTLKEQGDIVPDPRPTSGRTGMYYRLRGG